MEWGFWVVEETIKWFLELPKDLEELERIAERVDAISRTAITFFMERPPSDEERALIWWLMRSVRTERAQRLLSDLLV